MGNFVCYSVMSGIVLIPLYLIVKLVLVDHVGYRLNRFIILSCYLTAISLPALTLLTQTTPHIEIEILPYAVTASPGTASPDAGNNPGVTEALFSALIIIYFVGLAFFIAREIISWIKLYPLLSKSRKIRHESGRTLLLHDEATLSPFSWRNCIVMSKSDYVENGRMIILHECKHLDSRHWADLLLAECVSLFFWYNPAGWLMKDELQTIHEYEADEAVIHGGIDIKSYQLLLIKKAVGDRLPSIANSLKQSNLSKRIKMMLRKDSFKRKHWRAIAVVPAVAIGALVLNVDVVANGLQRLSDTKVTNYFRSTQESASSVDNQPAYAAMPASQPENSEDIYSAVEEMPKYPGGEAEMMKFVASHLKYPEEAIAQNVQGRIIVRFVVTSTGKIGNVEIVRGNDLLNQAAIDVVKAMPDFKPGKKNGKPVSVWYALPITFRLSDDDTPDSKTADKTEDTQIKPEVMPQFPGGEMSMMKFLMDNIKYPKSAVADSIQGRVIVKFVVTKSGKISNIKVENSLHPALDVEAIRVVNLMPDFIPGKVGGKPVDTSYCLPISFRLE